MSKVRRSRHRPTKSQSNDFYSQANEEWRRGRLRPAFRLFLAAAQGGNRLAFDTVGYFCDDGLGTKVDRDAAMYWYKRAHRCGSGMAANNIGVIYRDRNDLNRALAWFHRATRLGDGEANLNIAKIYLHNRNDVEKARYYLNLARMDSSTESGKDEAEDLLQKTLKAKPTRRAIRTRK